jgi:hypothetical protein
MANKKQSAVTIRFVGVIPVDLANLAALEKVGTVTIAMSEAIEAAGGEVLECSTRAGSHAFKPKPEAPDGDALGSGKASSGDPAPELPPVHQSVMDGTFGVRSADESEKPKKGK